ncbi:MAG: 30S ribosomal protein S17 [Pedosphaera sp.]|nr:30S ribosomal protein S17 [Pedosphaera sp.]
MPENETVSNAKELTGKVVSDKMSKTIVVRVVRRFQHPIFKKVVTETKKYYAHDEKELAGAGDTVTIKESRPLSRTKRWTLVQVLSNNPAVVAK